MKNLKFAALLCFVFGMQNAFSQAASHLILSDQYPAAGEKLTLNYTSTGTPLDGRTDIQCIVYTVSNRSLSAAEVKLAPSGTNWAGEFDVPDNAQCFFVRLSSGQDVDDNNQTGYIYPIYKDKQPIKGALASEAYVLTSGMGSYLIKTKTDNDKALDLYNRDFSKYPELKKDYATNYYTMLTGMPAYKDTVTDKITQLQKSSDEDDLILASSLMKATKNIKAADSLKVIIRTKYPTGTLVRNEAGMKFAREKNLAKKDSLYNDFIKKFPEKAGDPNTVQDNFRVQLASAYLEAGDMQNYNKYAAQVKNQMSLAGVMNNIAYEWAKKGDKLDDAAALSKKSLDIMTDAIANAKGAPGYPVEKMKKNYGESYDMYADTYAYILAKQNKYDEAFKYEQPVIDHSTSIDGDVYGNYINILVNVGQYNKAKEFAEKAIKGGQGSESIKASLKIAYVKLNGSDNGFDQYVANLSSVSANKTRDELAKTMINKPAPQFTLKDLDGKSVSLADLKGKVVIVDFWATWCGPCKASFPGMQLAVNKYKDNPNVKFLFLDTWENDDNYVSLVKNLLSENKYSFYVLLDDKAGDNGRRGKVVGDYGVDGIPTKFIIDKDGNIRFKYIGYSGTPEKLLEEVTDMVDMAGNPGTVSSSTGSGDNASKSGTNR